MKGKVLAELSAKSRTFLFERVNMPPAKGGVILETDRAAREGIFEKLIDGVPVNEENGTLNFSDKDGYDLYMTNKEWRALQDCFKDAFYKNMWEAQLGKRTLLMLENAEDCELDDEGQPLKKDLNLVEKKAG